MARKQEAAKLLLEGNSLCEIAGLMGISVNSVGGYLYSLAGEGRIRRSDILFGIPADWRRTVEATIERIKTSEAGNIESALRREGHTVDKEELAIYLTLRDSRVSLGDMHEFIAGIEQILHGKIRAVLIDYYGEECWWREGVPENIRKGCVMRQEGDSQPVGDKYAYTMFIDLKAIIDKQWKLFGLSLPADLTSHKPDLMNTLNHLNDIRNRVMHPAKGLSFTEEEFATVRSFHQSIDPRRWRVGESKV